MSDVRSHFDAEAQDYADRSVNGAWALLRKWELSAIMSLLRPQPGQRILDAGCGSGFYTEELCERGARVTAMDLSPSMLEALATRLDVPTLCGDLESTAIAPEFDKVLCAGALEFCGRPGLALENMARALDPSGPGELIVMSPSRSLPSRGYRAFHRRHGLAINLFSPDDYRAMGRRAGLRVEAATWAGFNYVVRYRRAGG